MPIMIPKIATGNARRATDATTGVANAASEPSMNRDAITPASPSLRDIRIIEPPARRITAGTIHASPSRSITMPAGICATAKPTVSRVVAARTAAAKVVGST